MDSYALSAYSETETPNIDSTFGLIVAVVTAYDCNDHYFWRKIYVVVAVGDFGWTARGQRRNHPQNHRVVCNHVCPLVRFTLNERILPLFVLNFMI